VNQFYPSINSLRKLLRNSRAVKDDERKETSNGSFQESLHVDDGRRWETMGHDMGDDE
jgi:hypothetical protein